MLSLNRSQDIYSELMLTNDREYGFPAAFTVVLRDGPDVTMGRLEIYHETQFGTVCNDTFGAMEAKAVCKSLGF